jgi:CheY-like chemotaxis protein
MERRRPRKAARPLVLVVDGDDDTKAMYVLGLSVLGFDAMAAENEAEACERACYLHPDIIVADLPTRDYDAWEFPRHLKENPRTQSIPVVVVSGHAQRVLRERAERAGCAAFFSKPCSAEELAAGLHQVLDGKADAFVPVERATH